MKAYLVNNFAPDGQESMKRFTRMMERGLTSLNINYNSIEPQARFSKLIGDYKYSGLGKWFGYIDKLVTFPRTLSKLDSQANEQTIFHIVDHSNAPYANSIRRGKSLVTCHDLLAVRGALGEDTDCPATPTGKILQKSILKGLNNADHVACVSKFTHADLIRLGHSEIRKRSSVILNGINHPYTTIPQTVAEERIKSLDSPSIAKMPFILHVGSNLKRKNKNSILKAFAKISTKWNGNLIFCGPQIPEDLRLRAHKLKISDRVINLIKPSNDIIEALLNRAHAFVFPSSSEGFGWPVIEAQSCGCPVIASNRTSLPEVAGKGAIITEYKDTEAISQSILDLTNDELRTKIIRTGFENAKRFTADRMVQNYVSKYRELAIA